jgi:hypothetical protein
MQAGTTDADRTIAVLSPRYLASVYGSGEWQAAWVGDPYGIKRKLLVVRVEECDRPGLLAGIVGVDLFGISEAMAETRLRNMVSAAISGRGKPSVKPGFPGTGRVMPRAVRFPGTYQQAYAELAQALLSSLSTVDSAASARTFVSQAANKVREASASIPEFYLAEFISIFKDATIAQRVIDEMVLHGHGKRIQRYVCFFTCGRFPRMAPRAAVPRRRVAESPGSSWPGWCCAGLPAWPRSAAARRRPTR